MEVILTVAVPPTIILSAATFKVALARSIFNLASPVVPLYSASTVWLPAFKPPTSKVAVVPVIGALPAGLPSTLIATLPVEPAGTVTTIWADSP